jgi:hypothetical protein
MNLDLTIAAGVALAIIFARVALCCGARWGAPALFVAFQFIGRNRRKFLAVLVLAMSVVLAPLFFWPSIGQNRRCTN